MQPQLALEKRVTSRSTEEILREEIRAFREINLKLYQWGVTLLASLQTVLFFARKEALSFSIQRGQLPQGTVELPLGRYLMGTSFLLIVATLFAVLSAYASRRYGSYRKQLAECQTSNIVEMPASGPLRFLMRCLYFVFPALDIGYRLYSHFIY